MPLGSRFPQTVTTYRCSNKDCQERKDKETADRIKLQGEKDLLKAARTHKKATI